MSRAACVAVLAAALLLAARSSQAAADDATRSEIEAAGSRHTVYTGDAFELSFYGNFVYPSCAMLHRSVPDRAGLFDETLRCAVDTEYFHRVSACAPLGLGYPLPGAEPRDETERLGARSRLFF